MAKKEHFTPTGKFRWFTMREALILLAVAAVIFVILMDKPYSTDIFSTVRPSLWKAADIDENAMSMVPSLKTSEDAALAPRIIIQDITNKAKDYETAEDYVKARINEEQSKEGFIFFEVGPEHIKNNDADVYYFTFTGGGGETSGVKIKEVTVKYGDKTYMIAYRAIVTRYDRYFKAAERVIDNFNLK